MQWVSAGLAFAGLLRGRRMFPRAIFVDLLERHHQDHPSNVHIVYYSWVKHAVQHFPTCQCSDFGFVGPLHPFRSLFYWRLQRFADVLVHVPQGTAHAVVRTAPPGALRSMRPPAFMMYSHTAIVLCVCAALLATADWRVDTGDVSSRLLLVLVLVLVQLWLR